MKNYLVYVLFIVAGISSDINGLAKINITADIGDPSFSITNVVITVPGSEINPIYQDLSLLLPSEFPKEEYRGLLTATLLGPSALELKFDYIKFKQLFNLKPDSLINAFKKGAIPLILPFEVALIMHSKKESVEKYITYTIIFDKIYGSTPITHSSEEEDEEAEYHFSCRGQDPSMLVIRQKE